MIVLLAAAFRAKQLPARSYALLGGKANAPV